MLHALPDTPHPVAQLLSPHEEIFRSEKIVKEIAEVNSK
jgi:hypothetical protein